MTSHRPRSRRQRQRRQRTLVAVVVIVLVIIIVLVSVLTSSRRRNSSSRNSADYTEFYGLNSDEDIIINVDDEVMADNGLYIDGEIYIPYDVLHSYVNSRFFWDGTEQDLRYTLPDELIEVSSPDTTTYTVDGEARETDYPIIYMAGDEMYLSLSFIEKFTDIRSSFYEDPNRVVISDEWGDVTYSVMKRATEVRELGGTNSPVLTTTSKNDPVIVLEEMDKWTKICTEDGFVGYVKNNKLGSTMTLTYSSNFPNLNYTHTLLDEPICMAWHQTTNQEANDMIYSLLEETSGINVISPTWFYLNDNEGGIASLCSYDYVNYCHERGIQVWALVSNLENPDVSSTTVLNTTSTRDALVDNLITQAVTYGVDGINVDFESLEGEAGVGFLQFVRELSLRCKANGLILSVDNYPPASYNAFYSRSEQANFADYVILMAYDEHYYGSDEGSVASIGFVRQSVADTLEEVPADQLILGIPLYTRMWQLTSTAEGYDLSSEALGMSEAESRISENGGSTVWLDEAGQYYGEYEADGSTYEVWLEDATSIDLKLQIMKEDDLAGAAFWRLGYEKASVWDTIVGYMQQ